jgi:hypothetical protein
MRLLFVIVLSFATSLLPAFAQSDVQPISLVGTWSATAKHPSGAAVVATVVFTQNQKFTGSVTVDDKPFWQYSGTWSVIGRTLTWRYEASTLAQAPAGTVDTDEVIVVDKSKLVLLSKLSGKQNEYLRAK